MKLSTTAIIFAFVTSVLGAPVPVPQPDQLECPEPVHWMNIQLHRLDDEAIEPKPDCQHTIHIVEHKELLPEEEKTEHELHQLDDEAIEPKPDCQHTIHIVEHKELLPEDEIEHEEQPDFDVHFRIGIVL